MIEIKEVNKRFEDVQAISKLNLKVEEGNLWSGWNERCWKEYPSADDLRYSAARQWRDLGGSGTSL